jgi:tetratricopeptide (TPR) repeat protein
MTKKMRNRVFQAAFASALALTTLTTSLSVALAAGDEERSDRIVDEASVEMQNEADRDLARLARKYRGTKREVGMLLRLAELRLEIAGGLFRVAYGPGETDLKKAYVAKLKAGIDPLNRILSVYSKSDESPRALYLRGKARKELGDSKAALSDLERFIAKYPTREESGIASLGIADLSIERGNYSRAVKVLTKLASTSSHPLHLIALSKRAWALQADGKPQSATAELSRLAKALNARTQAGTATSSDEALRQAVMGDVPGIAFLAHENNRRRFTLNSVNALFRSFDTGAGYQKMAIRFSEHLRTADLTSDLGTWKTIVLKSDPSQQSLEMLIGVMEYDLERGAFADMTKDASDIATVVAANPNDESAEAARKLVIRAADKLTKRITDYRKSVQSTEAEKYVVQLLSAFDRMTPASDARRFALRWNLAETHFALGRFSSAALAYRWIAANWNDDVKSSSALSPKKARLQAIESRFQSLRNQGVIPATLAVRASITPSKNTSKMAELREFIAWIAESEKMDDERQDHYTFESIRALYHAGYQSEALARAKTLALSNPGSSVAPAAAALTIDTEIAQKRWDLVENDAREFSSAGGWKSKTFTHEMLVQAAAAKFKRAEIAFAAKDYKLAGTQAREFRKTYASSNLSLDAMGIACNSDLNRGDLDSAVECFSDLAREFPKSKAAHQALRTVARIEDERLHFAAATNAYMAYLTSDRSSISKGESYAVRKRIVLLARAEGDAEKMEAVSKSKKVCAPRLEKECELNHALAALIRNDSSAKTVSAAFSRMGRGASELRSIWATLALEHSKYADPRSVDRAIKTLTSTWTKTDPSVQYFLIARITKSLPAILERDREAVKSIAILANEASITRRMRALQNFEARAGLVVQVPVNAVRAASQNELFLSYSDLINDLRSIPAPKGPTKAATRAMTAEQNRLIAGFVQPFVLKSRKIRDASMALALKESRGLDIDAVDSLWDKPITGGSAYAELRSQWAKAIRSGNWSRVAFFSNEVADMKNVPSSWSKAARAISLANAGAGAEAKTVFQDACRNTSGSSSLRDACRAGNRSAKGRG